MEGRVGVLKEEGEVLGGFEGGELEGDFVCVVR